MVRRDPRQASLTDALDPTLVGPIVRPGADPVWAARLLELVAEGLPPGAPAPFGEVLSLRPAPPSFGKVYALWGEVRMFDGAVHQFQVQFGSRDYRVYSFGYPLGMEDAPRFDWKPAYPSFWWDPAAGVWVRGEPDPQHYAGHWCAELSRPGFERRLTGMPVDPRLRTAIAAAA